jgi:hypothetical protein
MSGGSGGRQQAAEKSYTNVLWNTLEPVYGGPAIMGSAQYVAIETSVGQIVRRIMGMSYNWWDSAETHTFSLPVIGQLNFGEAFGALTGDVDLMKEATEGAKSIPGAIVGYTAHKIRKEGLRIPAYGNRDFVAMLVGKVVSRPVQAYLINILPTSFQGSQAVLNALFNKQREVAKA